MQGRSTAEYCESGYQHLLSVPANEGAAVTPIEEHNIKILRSLIYLAETKQEVLI